VGDHPDNSDAGGVGDARESEGEDGGEMDARDDTEPPVKDGQPTRSDPTGYLIVKILICFTE
jgi:hypothetical protein